VTATCGTPGKSYCALTPPCPALPGRARAGRLAARLQVATHVSRDGDRHAQRRRKRQAARIRRGEIRPFLENLRTQHRRLSGNTLEPVASREVRRLPTASVDAISRGGNWRLPLGRHLERTRRTVLGPPTRPRRRTSFARALGGTCYPGRREDRSLIHKVGASNFAPEPRRERAPARPPGVASAAAGGRRG